MELERGLLRFKLFLSTPSARRATSASAGRKCPGSDFYPRPPRGGRHSSGVPGAKQFLFLSTPSARRATSSGHWSRRVPWHFYPRPPRGGRQRVRASGWGYRGISIHALREEGDGAICCKPWSTRHFYPRPPRGGRRECIVDIDSTTEISIHALREEGDGGNQHGCLDERISIHALREEGDVSGPVLVSTS